ncbi:MAG TPA: hypothetical protein VMT89_04550 [Candidatus Acidoferrales bacterium]|nr:hypothetical protein [Candidatus Acidoferrales bacterium]
MAISRRPTGTHFDPAKFDGQILQHGTPALWRKASLCPCLNPKTLAPDVNCISCRDLPGWVWDDGSSVIVFGPGRERRDVYDEEGHRIEGLVRFTLPSAITPGHVDRLDLLVAELVYNGEKFIRGKVDAANRSLERVRVRPVIAVERVLGRVAGNVQDFLVDTDVSIQEDGTIQWDNPPPDGTLYTVRYRSRPAYVCWEPMSRDEGGARQPYRVRAQRIDFFRQPAVGG